MNGTLSISNLFSGANARTMAAPIFIVLILAMLVLPLPPFALDMLFTFNIALSIMVLLVGLSTKKALDFAAFPTVLLLSTCCACRSTSPRPASCCWKAIPDRTPPAR